MFYFSIFLIKIPIRFIYVQIESRTSRCNFLSLFSTFLPVQPVVQIMHTAHIRILKPWHNMSETFLGFRTFWWEKTNAERGCWTWEITMYFLNYAYTYPSNFFFRATFLMCVYVLQVEPLPSTVNVIAVLEHSGMFERRCQTKPRHDCLVKVPCNFLWNEIM